jgi:hypothetical protein
VLEKSEAFQALLVSPSRTKSLTTKDTKEHRGKARENECNAAIRFLSECGFSLAVKELNKIGSRWILVAIGDPSPSTGSGFGISEKSWTELFTHFITT